MWIAQFKDDKLFHRVKSACGDGKGGFNAEAFCEHQGPLTRRDSEEITCPKCKEIHIKLTMERLHG